MIENIRTHPYTRAVCLETARLFEHRAAKHLVEAQDWADQGVANSALEFQTKARLAQQRANAWHLRAKNAPLAELLKPDCCRAPPRSSLRAAGARDHQHLARASG